MRTPETEGVISKEHSEQGRVKKDVYIQYIEAASKTGFTLVILATFASQLVSVAANSVLRLWGEHNRAEGGNTGVGKYLLGYGLFSLSSILLNAVASILIWLFCSVRSAKQLHDSVRSDLSYSDAKYSDIIAQQMLYAIMRAPMTFFEQTPTGR